MRPAVWPLAACLLTGACTVAPVRDVAPPIVCTTVSVHDGDTLTADCPAGRLHVRLREIDAPERTQPYARISTDALAALCLGQPVTLAERALDRYGRTLARVRCGPGSGVDVASEQVRAGLAWAAAARYLTDPQIAALEREARAARRGLWRQAEPLAPWDFRHPPAEK